MRKNLNLIIGILIGTFLLYLFLRKADFEQFKKSLTEANYGIIFIVLILILFTYCIRAFRWQLFLLPIKKAKVSNLISTTIIGFSITTLLPGRLGEIARPCLLGIKENISKSCTFATVIVERLFDFITIFCLFSLYLLFKPASSGNSSQEQLILTAYKKGGIIGLSISLSLMLILIIIHLKTHWFQSLIDILTSRLPRKLSRRLRKPLKSFIEGLVIIDIKRNLPYLIMYSLGLWLAISLSYWLIMIAFGISLPFYFSLFIMTAAAIGALIPTPGAVGGYHIALQIAFVTFWGINEDLSRAMAIVMHALSFFPVAILGILFIWLEGLSLSKIKKLPQDMDEKINLCQ